MVLNRRISTIVPTTLMSACRSCSLMCASNDFESDSRWIAPPTLLLCIHKPNSSVRIHDSSIRISLQIFFCSQTPQRALFRPHRTNMLSPNLKCTTFTLARMHHSLFVCTLARSASEMGEPLIQKSRRCPYSS